MRRHLPAAIIAAMILGILAGPALGPGSRFLVPIGAVADLFLDLLRMIVIPLITTSLVSGVLSIRDLSDLGRLGSATLAYYIASSGFAVLTGLIMVNIVRPGIHAELALSGIPATLPDSGLGGILRRIVPVNPFSVLASGEVLPVIFFSLFLGIVILSLPVEKTGTVRAFFTEGFTVMMKMTDWILLTAPIGIFALVTRVLARTGLDVIVPLARYFLTVFSALCVHACITLPLVILIIGRRSPLTYFRACFPALATAFSTASSSATLPLTMECVRDRASVSGRVTAFVLPLGATVNMDGTALYEAVAAVFIAQAYGIPLGIVEQLTIFATAVLASIGAAGIPMAGLVMMAVVLRAVGLPLEGVGLIVGVDRLLDMARTATNVWSDATGCTVVERLTR